MLSRFAVVLVLALSLTLTNGTRISSSTQITQKLRQRTQTELTTGVESPVFYECFLGTGTSTSCDVTDPVDLITKISDQCESTPKKGSVPKSISSKTCITPTAGPYGGKCCCVYELTSKHNKPIVLCDATVSSLTSWKAPVPPKLPTMKAVTLSIKTISDPGVSDLRSAIGASHRIDLLTNPKYRIKLDGTLTEYPPSNVLDHIALRLNILDADVHTYHKLPLAPILHQTGLYRRLLLEDSLKTDEAFLRVVVLGIANLHAAIKMVQFLSEKPDNALVPVFSGTGDHFLANTIIGNNDYNGFMLHPLQIQGHYDPADAVAFLRKKVKSELQKTNSKPDKSLLTLLIRTLGLDMSVWGRLKSPSMRFNGAITDDDWSNLYLHIQDEITKNADTYIDNLSK